MSKQIRYGANGLRRVYRYRKCPECNEKFRVPNTYPNKRCCSNACARKNQVKRDDGSWASKEEIPALKRLHRERANRLQKEIKEKQAEIDALTVNILIDLLKERDILEDDEDPAPVMEWLVSEGIIDAEVID